MRILIVEDYAPLRRSLERGLTANGYAVDAVGDGSTGLEYARSGVHDLIVLDLMLPELDGVSLLRALRAARSDVPVLILSARDTVGDRVGGLDVGADDYLVKPFAFDELLARVRALLRRSDGRAGPVIRVGDLEVDPAARLVRRAGREISLTARELAILEVLASRAGRVVTRDEIRNAVYDFDTDRVSNVVDVYVRHLRQKLEADGGSRLIHTRRGLGYVLEGGGS